MAYQNVGTPRFYVDMVSYFKSIGATIADDYSKIGINPSNILTTDTLAAAHQSILSYGDDTTVVIPKKIPLNFMAILGHNYAGRSLNPHFHIGIPYYANNEPSFVNIINSGDNSDRLEPENDGFSIFGINYSVGADSPISKIILYQNGNDEDNWTSHTYKTGSFIIGNYYDMPHAPDLNLKLSYEYDGIKNIQSKGGATLSNASYTKPADWGSAGAWQLGGASNLRSGRRVWDLSFSYLSDTDVFPVNASQSLAAYTNTDYNTTSDPVDINTGSANGGTAGEFTSNILDGTDFFSQVWNRTMGGHLPFIFQPDGSNNNPDQFAIARFDQSSLQLSQISPNIYNVKLKIRETW